MAEGRVFCLLRLHRRDPDKIHAHASGALAVTPQGVPDEERRVRTPLKWTESSLKNRRVRLFNADTMAIGHGAKVPRKAGAGAHGLQVAVEIRDDAQPIALGEIFEHGPVARESGSRLSHEARR